jgi:G3E family GTPase
MDSPIPVYLLTGFLGSGKTSLLKRLIRQPAFADTAVIVNEFGEIGLDNVLIEKSDDRDVVLLDSGCLCCASSSALESSLEDLYYRRLRGSVPRFARVVIETSGLADPLPLMNALHADASVARHFRLAGVLTTIDVLNSERSLREYRECALQLAVADRVLLTKADLAAAVDVDAVVGEVARSNAWADVVVLPPPGGDAVPDVLDGLASDPRRAMARPPADPASAAGSARFAHLLRYGITSHAFRLAGSISWQSYADWVHQTQRTLGERLLRAKGILHFDDGTDYAIHGVRHLFGAPQPVSAPEGVRGSLVLITRDVDAAEARASIHPIEGSR